MSDSDKRNDIESTCDNDSKDEKNSYQKGTYIGIGIALGVVFGVLLHNIAVGIAIGVAIGISMDSSAVRKNKN
ncbi:hypothetical protein JK636_21390 [Clostridium sp. YIM B02515]|jgi:zinc transporter ZupT|uniref:Glycine zipper-like domain-containing protein n=1 Tax=Clostridium rhizosphaerae TaxID=2803861 RepID=A0ABS1TG21_9CLOT|nr:hypothetical protein [Clostridium rhizosphaerae]MBL4938270.1 hypothetical protein [Clostridium rhizosphaerae]